AGLAPCCCLGGPVWGAGLLVLGCSSAAGPVAAPWLPALGKTSAGRKGVMLLGRMAGRKGWAMGESYKDSRPFRPQHPRANLAFRRFSPLSPLGLQHERDGSPRWLR